MIKLAITVAALIVLTSCSIEDVCGTVEGWSTFGDNYYLTLDGMSTRVNYNTFLKAQTGEYICVSY